MRHNANTNTVKPTLERLEDRLQPSVLFGAGSSINILVTPLNSILADMQTARAKLATDFNNAVTLLGTNPNGDNVRTFVFPFGKAVADYQQILTDQAAIHLTVSTDQSFLQAVALAEAVAGDPTDFLILNFFKGSTFDPTTQLTNVQNQANQIVNDPTVLSEVSKQFFLRAPTTPGFDPTRDIVTIAGEVNKPTFGQ